VRYQLFGRTGLRVSELCLGTMNLSEEWGWGASKEHSRALWNPVYRCGVRRFTDLHTFESATSITTLQFLHLHQCEQSTLRTDPPHKDLTI
jgi:hypothetical protein